MKYAFASRTGNVEEIISSLGIDALRINDGSESIDESTSYLLIQMAMEMYLLKSKTF